MAMTIVVAMSNKIIPMYKLRLLIRLFFQGARTNSVLLELNVPE